MHRHPIGPTRDAARAGFRADLPRWRQLVTPAWLASLIAGAAPAAAPAGEWRLLEAGFGALAQYQGGHIAGAAYVDTTQIEGGVLWNKLDDAVLLQLLLAHGIACDVTVVLYGRNNLAAARLAHVLLYAGVADVRLLDGGLAGWRGAGLPLTQASPAPARPAASFGAPFPGRPDYLFDMARARAMLAQPDGVLVSTRTWNEFVGKYSGYPYIAARGDIAGARWGRAGAGDDINSMSAFHDDAGRMRPAAQIRRMWQAAGIDAQQHAVFYCGTGWRASLAFFYAWLMGWERIAVFDGGWCEWSRDGANPVRCRIDEDAARASACASDQRSPFDGAQGNCMVSPPVI
ncbi:sulfurtransferase [Massilia sp. DWR3-1-1]|uniref:sulfurtransferase n=1 Tax=Massilia sp. DWR3-1-1 TaxID=2804559 RepID=UPI003CF7FF3F